MTKSCFVISVIGSDGSEDRQYADRLFKHLIEPSAKEAGFTKIQRADHIDETGMITIQVVEAIMKQGGLDWGPRSCHRNGYLMRKRVSICGGPWKKLNAIFYTTRKI